MPLQMALARQFVAELFVKASTWWDLFPPTLQAFRFNFVDGQNAVASV
jgi:hypothetical protein